MSIGDGKTIELFSSVKKNVDAILEEYEKLTEKYKSENCTIVLDVGGKIFKTTKKTLCCKEGYFKKLLNCKEYVDKESIFVGKFFPFQKIIFY